MTCFDPYACSIAQASCINLFLFACLLACLLACLFACLLDGSSFGGSPTNAGTHYKVILVSNEFEHTQSDVVRGDMVNAVLAKAEQLRGPSQDQQVPAAAAAAAAAGVNVNVNTLMAMTPAEHERVVSKYSTPHQWLAMAMES
jgi:hypothetical protein